MSKTTDKDEVFSLVEAAYVDGEIFLQNLIEDVAIDDTSWPILFSSVSTVVGTERASWLAQSLKEQLEDTDGQKAAIIAAAAAGAAIGGVILPAVGSAFGAVLGGVAGYFSPGLVATDEASSARKEATERALQYASDEFERLLYLKKEEELSEEEFRAEIDSLYKHARQTLSSIL